MQIEVSFAIIVGVTFNDWCQEETSTKWSEWSMKISQLYSTSQSGKSYMIEHCERPRALMWAWLLQCVWTGRSFDFVAYFNRSKMWSCLQRSEYRNTLLMLEKLGVVLLVQLKLLPVYLLYHFLAAAVSDNAKFRRPRAIFFTPKWTNINLDL